MKNIHWLFAISILVSLTACSSEPFKKEVPAMADDPVASSDENSDESGRANLNKNTTASIPMGVKEPEFAEYAFYYLIQNKSKFGLRDPSSQLALINENIDNNGNKHVKYQQVYHGVPVWGKQIIVHLDHTNTVTSATGGVLKGINIANVKPGVSKEKAADLVMQDKKWTVKGWQVEDTKLYILYQDDNYNLVYRITLGDGFPREYVFLNAQNGKLIHGIKSEHKTN